MSVVIRLISSMATRLLLEDLSAQYQAAYGIEVQLESMGGVDATRRIRDGELFDVAVLASGAMRKLIEADCIVADSFVDLVHSNVAIAVPAGQPHPDISTEDAVQDAVLSAKSISHSTGPSGVALSALFERWGIANEIAGRIQIPPPGTPVGSLLVSGQAVLGFQQYAELMNVDGIDVLGPLPDPVRIETIFSGGLCVRSEKRESATRLLDFFNSDGVVDCKHRYGMESA